jgi:hypothetical protein
MKYSFLLDRISHFLINGTLAQIMVNAHVDSMILLATPFKSSTVQPFAFGRGSEMDQHHRENQRPDSSHACQSIDTTTKADI